MSIQLGDEEQLARRKKRAKVLKRTLAALPLLLLLLRRKKKEKTATTESTKTATGLPKTAIATGVLHVLKKALSQGKKGGVSGFTAVLIETLLAKLKERAKAKEEETEKAEEAREAKETEIAKEAREAKELETAEATEEKEKALPPPDFPHSANVRGIAKGKNGEIYVLFSRGDIYRYEPSMEGMIYASLQKPYAALTSGENAFKRWRKGTPSIGGSFWQLVAKPSRRIGGTYKKVSSAPKELMDKRTADLVLNAIYTIARRVKSRSLQRP